MMSTANKSSAILSAREIIKSLKIEDPSEIDIEAIAMERGAIVKEDYLHGAEGRLLILKSYGLITVKKDIPELGKKRFIIAHELGHFELHRLKIPIINCSDSDFSEWMQNKPQEVEANYFAAELIMPENIFIKKTKGKQLNKKLLDMLCNDFQTSLTATSIRFVILNKEYALICSENSLIKWFVIGDRFPYKLNVKGKLHPYSIASNYFKNKKVEHSFLSIPSETWIDDYMVKTRIEVMEMAVPLPTYNQVLSFIYVISDEDN